MKTEKHENKLNEQHNAPATLADLPVTDEQAQQVAGGTDVFNDVIVSASGAPGGHVKVFDGSTGRVGSVASSSNHNETTVRDGEADGQVRLADLSVADEQAEEIKGGPLSNVEYTITVTDTQRG